jgi:RNA polymerase sigma-70 factor, ECF subfamily
MDDTELLAGLRRGDDSAFAEIFRTFYPSLVGAAERVVVERAAAEDVVQEVMLELWRRRESMPAELRLRAYLFQSTRNRALNQIRHLRVVREGEPHAPHPYAPPPTEAESVAGELDAALRLAVLELPPEVRETFRMSRVDGLTYPEIARALEISIKTVEARMGRALRLLRERLAPWLPAGGGW